MPLLESSHIEIYESRPGPAAGPDPGLWHRSWRQRINAGSSRCRPACCGSCGSRQADYGQPESAQSAIGPLRVAAGHSQGRQGSCIRGFLGVGANYLQEEVRPGVGEVPDDAHSAGEAQELSHPLSALFPAGPQEGNVRLPARGRSHAQNQGPAPGRNWILEPDQDRQSHRFRAYKPAVQLNAGTRVPVCENCPGPAEVHLVQGGTRGKYSGGRQSRVAAHLWLVELRNFCRETRLAACQAAVCPARINTQDDREPLGAQHQRPAPIESQLLGFPWTPSAGRKSRLVHNQGILVPGQVHPWHRLGANRHPVRHRL